MFVETKHRQQEAFLGTAFCLFIVILIGSLTDSLFVMLFLLCLMSSPLWLPYAVVQIRYKIFASMNGEEGIELPNPKFDDKIYKYLYNHKASNLRSNQKNVGLSDFFWYLLGPAHYIHQEHLEACTKEYQAVAAATRSIVNKPASEFEAICDRYLDDWMRELESNWHFQMFGVSWTCLRDWFFPLYLKMLWELTFDQQITKHELKIVYTSVRDVIVALKFNKIRNMTARHALTELIMDKLNTGAGMRHFEDDTLPLKEKALFIQGVVLTTGAVQIAEAMAHTCVALAQHNGNFNPKLIDPKHASQSKNISNFLSELLRMYPLFGIAHRITSEDITLPNGDQTVIPKGSVLCFNYPKFHRMGYENANKFIPSRWNTCNGSNSNYIPFGAKNNRPCPGRNIAWYWMKYTTKALQQKFTFHTSILHTRSMPDGGSCIIIPRKKDSVEISKFHQYMLPLLMTTLWVHDGVR